MRLSASPAETQNASIQERLNRLGADLFSRTNGIDLPETIRELKAILALDPRLAEGHMLLGVAYELSRSPDLKGEAVAELRQALALSPALAPARLYLAYVYLDLDRPKRARQELEAALVQVPGDPQLLALLGESQRRLGNPTRSVELTRQVLQADASFAQARYYLGLALLDLRQWDEGIRELERVVESGIAPVDAYVSLGTAYLDAERPDDALEVLRQGSQVDPSRAEIRIHLARAHRLKGLLAEAEELLKGAMAAGTPKLSFPVSAQLEAVVYLEWGLLRLQQGRLEAAAEAFRKVLDMDSDHGPTNRHLAEVYLLQGSYTRALEHAVRAEKLGFPLSNDKRKLLEEKRRGKQAGSRR